MCLYNVVELHNDKVIFWVDTLLKNNCSTRRNLLVYIKTAKL